MKKRPYFSIIILTYNRAKDLELAIKCILSQNFSDFELIISDNHSTDSTEDVVKKFKDKRIRYFKREKNFGWILNLQKAIKDARGEYVILHGDDDFLLFDNALRFVHDLLKRGKYGFIRLNYLKQSYDKKGVFDYFKRIFGDKEIKHYRNSEQIISFLLGLEPFFVTGIVYKNYRNSYKDIIESELGPWFKIIYKNTYEGGGYVVAKHYIVATWSRDNFGSYYYLKNNKFKFEKYYEEVARVVSTEYYKTFLKTQLRELIILLPAAKYYLPFSDFKKYVNRILILYPRYKYKFIFWLFLIAAIATPKVILRLIRSYNENSNKSYEIKNIKEIEKRLRYIRSLT